MTSHFLKEFLLGSPEGGIPSGLFIISLGFSVILLIASAFLIFFRLFAGPSHYDRALSINCFGTLAVLFLVVFSVLVGREDFLDVPMLYVMVNFVSTVAILKFFRYRSLSQKITYNKHARGSE